MSAAPARPLPRIRAVRWWLLSVAALIAIMVLVGGATRLTESGLSIVEWKPVTGTVPPLNQKQWTEAFEAYQTIPQYRELNAGMNLAEFKTIFWWEWSHRALGRVIGVAYLLPFLWFLWRGVLSADLKRRPWVVFRAGGLAGGPEAAAVADLRPRCAAGCGRLVDGGLRAFAAGRGFAISARYPSGAGASVFCRGRLDAAPTGGPAIIGCIFAAEDHQHGAAGVDLRAALSGRAGRGPARRQDLQHLAGHRRRVHSAGIAAVLRNAVV